MAIMARTEGVIEARVKRHSGKYYDEYVKVNPCGGSPYPQNEIYIIAEPGTMYYVEVKLKAGFNFGKCDLIQAKLYMDSEEISLAEFKSPCHESESTKSKKDFVKQIRYANIEINGRAPGSNFVFGSVEMEIDEQLSKEDDTMSILTHNLPTLQVYFNFFESFIVTLSDDEYKEAITSWERDCARLRSESQNLTLPGKPDRTKKFRRCVQCKEGFRYFPRSADFFENNDMAEYPALLHLYDWSALKQEERKIALGELQDQEKVHWAALKGKKDGEAFQLKVDLRLSDDYPREWRSWRKLYGAEQKKAFQVLQERRRARERGETRFQYKSIGGAIMSFGEEDESAELVTVPEKPSPNQPPVGEASAPVYSPFGANRPGSVAALPYGMREDPTIDIGSYPLPYTNIFGMEGMGVAAPPIARPIPAMESPVVIPNGLITESTQVNVTTPHRNKTVIPGVEFQLESVQSSLIDQINEIKPQIATAQASTPLIKGEPTDLTPLDFDAELVFVSETKVSKAVRHTDPARAAKSEVSKVVDKELQELEELQKLREEKEKLQRDIELLEKKRKMDEITKQIEDAEARAKKIKNE